MYLFALDVLVLLGITVKAAWNRLWLSALVALVLLAAAIALTLAAFGVSLPVDPLAHRWATLGLVFVAPVAYGVLSRGRTAPDASAREVAELFWLVAILHGIALAWALIASRAR